MHNARVYRSSTLDSEEIKWNIQEVIHRGHICPNSFPCGIQIVLVYKKDGTFRLCIDYRALKKTTVRNWYLIQRIDDLLDQLKGRKYFSKIDLKSSYHKVPKEHIDVWRTSLKSKEGIFEWMAMPFVLTNAPTTLRRRMDDIMWPFTHINTENNGFNIAAFIIYHINTLQLHLPCR